MAKRLSNMTKEHWAWIKALKVPAPRLLWNIKTPYVKKRDGAI